MQEVIITNKKLDYLLKLAECKNLILYSKTGNIYYYADTRDYDNAYALSQCIEQNF